MRWWRIGSGGRKGEGGEEQTEREKACKVIQWTSWAIKVLGEDKLFFVYKKFMDSICVIAVVIAVYSLVERNWPLLVALTYAEERRFNPEVPSSAPSMCKTRDNETIVRKHSKILISSFAEHSITLTLNKWMEEATKADTVRKRRI